MKITRRKLRSLILESMLSFPEDFILKLKQIFKIEIMRTDRVLKLIKNFDDGCQVILVIIFLDSNRSGELNIYLAELATLDSQGEINDMCYKKGYANIALSEFLNIADEYEIIVDLTASSKDEEKFPNNKLVDFYSRKGFKHYGGTNINSDEMRRWPLRRYE